MRSKYLDDHLRPRVGPVHDAYYAQRNDSDTVPLAAVDLKESFVGVRRSYRYLDSTSSAALGPRHGRLEESQRMRNRREDCEKCDGVRFGKKQDRYLMLLGMSLI